MGINDASGLCVGRILLSNVDDSVPFDMLGRNPVDDNVIGMRNDLARSRHPTSTEHVRVLGRRCDGSLNALVQALCCGLAVFGNERNDLSEIVFGLLRPKQPQHG